jgi:hypothetical protein
VLKDDLFYGLKEKIYFSISDYRKEEDLPDFEKLDRKFLWYGVEKVCSQYSIRCTNQFILMLNGLTSLNKGTIEVIQFTHPEYGNNYSYAILVEGPFYNFISDYASWYLFLDFATDHSGTGSKAKQYVDTSISVFGPQIHLTSCSINAEDLKEYVKEKEINELENKIKIIKDNFADAKGLILELLNAYFLSKLGFEVVWSFKEKFTDNMEIDLGVFKKYRNKVLFYIIEITTTGKKLHEEVQKKIEILKRNSSQLLNFLGIKENLRIKFKGLVISNDYTNLQGINDIKIINFEDIINNSEIFRMELKKKILNVLKF